MSSLQKRVAYLGLADFDYLSARLLLLCGLGNTAFPKAMEAFEKLFKLFLVLAAKIERDKELEPKDLKQHGHELVALFDTIVGMGPLRFAPDVREYFVMMQDSYSRRYPEHWKEHRLDLDIGRLDRTYCFFRNLVSQNFPVEERERARRFGTFLSDAYSPDIEAHIRSAGGIPPTDALRLQNLVLADFRIDNAGSDLLGMNDISDRIRYRAYFLWANRSGRNWANAEDNWQEAEVLELAMAGAG